VTRNYGIGGRVFGILGLAENVAVVSFLIVTLCCGVLQVIGRYVIPAPVAWTEELARFMFIWTVFIGAVVAVRERQHVAMELVLQYFTERNRALLSGLICCACILIIGFTLPGTFKILKSTSTSFSTILGIRMAYIYASWPLSAILMTVHFSDLAIGYFRSFFSWGSLET